MEKISIIECELVNYTRFLLWGGGGAGVNDTTKFGEFFFEYKVFKMDNIPITCLF
jgi:hypothetical protein